MKKFYLAIGTLTLLLQQQAQAQFKIIGTEFSSGFSRVFTDPPSHSSNVMVGGNTGATGSQNTFIGSNAGANNNGGLGNAFVGETSGRSNTSGNYNAFFGHTAGFSNTSGAANTFMGYLAGYKNTTASHNSFFGQGAGVENTIGFFNTFIGQSAGNKNLDGDQNTYVGQWAGYNGTSGNNNAFLGKEAGYTNTTGSSNTAIGSFADFTLNNLQYATAIGFNAKAAASNALVLGGTGTFAVKVGIGVANPAQRLHLEGSSDEDILVRSTNSLNRSGLNLRNDAGNDLLARLFGTTAPSFALNPVGAAPAVPYANLGMLTTGKAPLMIGVHALQLNVQDEQNIHSSIHWSMAQHVAYGSVCASIRPMGSLGYIPAQPLRPAVPAHRRLCSTSISPTPANRAEHPGQWYPVRRIACRYSPRRDRHRLQRQPGQKALRSGATCSRLRYLLVPFRQQHCRQAEFLSRHAG